MVYVANSKIGRTLVSAAQPEVVAELVDSTSIDLIHFNFKWLIVM